MLIVKKSPKKIILRIVIVLLCLFLLPCLINGGYALYESTLYGKPGEMIQTENGKMHVYSQVQGENGVPVYVFLDGFGGGSSYYNYKMLWEPLAGEATIVTIDYLGYGMSESTNAERTVDNIVSEIDTALSHTGIEGPYTFVSHSLGGFYATGYSIKYPQKVAALILLDNAIPDDVLSGGDEEMASYKQARPLYMLLKYTGILRFMTDSGSPWLSEEEQKASTYFEIKTLLNRSIMNEIDNTTSNALYLTDQKVPSSIPELILVSNQNNDASIGQETTWLEYHESFQNENPHSTVLLMNTGHYMHYEAADAVLDAIHSFSDAFADY